MYIYRNIACQIYVHRLKYFQNTRKYKIILKGFIPTRGQFKLILMTKNKQISYTSSGKKLKLCIYFTFIRWCKTYFDFRVYSYLLKQTMCLCMCNMIIDRLLLKKVACRSLFFLTFLLDL